MTQELPEGTVTILFTDVVGSTELTNRLGDEAARELLGACDVLVRRQIERHRGREVKGTGDGLMVAFTSARRAIACAVDIRRATAERSRSEPDRAVSVRIGLNTGEVIREEADLFGATVTAAARIADHASAGEILLSDAVKGVLGTATTVELEDRGDVELKGFPEPWHLHAVRWEEKAAGPALGERTPYVGREEERQQLRRCLDEATQGKGSLVMVGGEPGVGKTRLTEELVSEARERGFLTLTGHCYEMEGGPPYIPFVEILEAAARVVPGEAFREALGDAAPEVAKIMPELRRLFPDIPAAVELPAEQERRYLFNSFLEFVERAGRGQPLVLVLEDLHWGDDSTLLLLQHIAQRLGEMPVMIVGTYRDVELDDARPLAQALEDLLRQRLASRLALKRLPEAEVQSMLRALSGQEPPSPLVQIVYSETEGNPFFVEEVYRHLIEERKLFDESGQWRSDLEVGELDVPEGVRLVITRRLRRVSEDTRQVLTGAAIIGRVFSFELLEAMAEVASHTPLDAVDEAEQARLVTSASGGREARFSFAHELIRQTLVSSISLPRRQRLHLRVADAMEKAYADALDDHAADLAHHLYQAGAAADAKKTAHYLTLAGDQALAAAAFEDALRHYETGLSLLSADDHEGRGDLLFKRGSALRSLGSWDEAIADWQEALSAYEEIGDTEKIGRVCPDMSWQLAWSNRTAEGVEVARRGLKALGKEPSADRCRLVAMTGVNLSLAADYTGGEGAIAQALEMAERLGDDRLLGQVLTYKTAHHWYFMQMREAVEGGLRAVDLLRSESDDWGVANALWYAHFALLMLGRLDEVAKIGEELEPLAARVGHLGALLIARRGDGARDFMITGDIDGSEERWKADMELCRRTGFPWISNSYTALGSLHLLRGRWEEALGFLEEAASLEPPGFGAGADRAGLFVCRAYGGDREAALAMLPELMDHLPRSGQANTLGAWAALAQVIEGLAVLHRRDDVARLYPLVQNAIDMGTLTCWGGGMLSQSMAGISAAAGQRWDRAEDHFHTALRQAHEVPHKIEQPEVRRWYARMLIDRDGPGDRDKARELLTEAVAMYTKIGMPKHIEMAETMLGEV